MLTYKELRWGNCFSYGDNNSLRLDKSPITQLVGKNGHGKSSIALILEEVQFNKNSKGIKKAGILNRYADSSSYWIELDFDKNGDSYTISTTRTTSTQKVSLTKNGEDISSHTATATFKLIEDILGFDHTTFTQIVYQSSADSLQFLSATDTQRKKFLIELLKLSKYGKALELFKELATSLNAQLVGATASLTKLRDWKRSYEQEEIEVLPLMEVPTAPVEYERRVAVLEAEKSDIIRRSKTIRDNNSYKAARDRVVLVDPPRERIEDIESKRNEVLSTKVRKASIESEMSGLQKIKTVCPTCRQPLVGDHSHIKEDIERLDKELKTLAPYITKLEAEITAFDQANAKALTTRNEYEKYHNLWDQTLPTEVPTAEAIDAEIAVCKAEISVATAAISAATKHNAKVAANLARAELVKEKLAKLVEEEAELQLAESRISNRLNNVTVLVKAFSTTGLVAYKIECMVKDLESLTNEYLADLSDGRFLLRFEISSADKLNVIITDGGTDIEFNALSAGERARVNVAALLGIRALTQAISDTKTNLLVLDETIEHLDAEGKEKFIEILVQDHVLNTFLISHSFTHPLIEKLQVTKTDGISEIREL